MQRFAIALMLVLAAPLAGAEVPVTDREQKLAFSAVELHLLADAAYRNTLREQRRRAMLDRDRGAVRKLRRLAGRLIAQAIRLKPEAADWKWEIHLSDDPQVDAYCMAGGKLLVGSRFIASYHLSDEELAIVLGHEIGHAIAEHIREQATAVLLRNPKNLHRKLPDVLAKMDSDLSVYLALMPLSRAQEIEADQIGIRLAAMAGFRPATAISFYRKLARGEQAARPLFDTHGSSDLRRRVAAAIVADSNPVYHAAINTAALPSYPFR